MLSAIEEDGQPMTDEQLRDEMMRLLGLGYEATATALAWAFYWIHQLPEVKQKLLQEIDSLGEKPDPMEIYRLPYLTAVCQETLKIKYIPQSHGWNKRLKISSRASKLICWVLKISFSPLA